jgi:nitroreductase
MELARAFQRIVGRRFAARTFSPTPVDPAVLRDCLSMTQARPQPSIASGAVQGSRCKTHPASVVHTPPCRAAGLTSASRAGVQRAPSSFNTQPWVAIVVTSEARKAALAAAMLGDNGSKVPTQTLPLELGCMRRVREGHTATTAAQCPEQALQARTRLTQPCQVTAAPVTVVFAADMESSKLTPRVVQLAVASGAPPAFTDNLPLYIALFGGGHHR